MEARQVSDEPQQLQREPESSTPESSTPEYDLDSEAIIKCAIVKTSLILSHAERERLNKERLNSPTIMNGSKQDQRGLQVQNVAEYYVRRRKVCLL